MDANGLVDSIVKGYFIAATLRLLFNKNKNPLNMETVMNGAKIGAADFGYNANGTQQTTNKRQTTHN